MLNQAAGLAVDFGCQTRQFIKDGLVDVLAIECPDELAANLGARALGVGEEFGEFCVGAAIEAFGDVVHRGTHSPIQLIDKGKVFAESTRLEDIPEPLVQDPGDLPGLDFFK